MYEYFIENELISPSQYGFKPSDSYINQLLSITHDIYQFFGNGVAGKLLNTLANVLKDRKQRVVLNGQHSALVNVEAGVPQDSILGTLFFLIYIYIYIYK